MCACFWGLKTGIFGSKKVIGTSGQRVVLWGCSVENGMNSQIAGSG